LGKPLVAVRGKVAKPLIQGVEKEHQWTNVSRGEPVVLYSTLKKLGGGSR